MGAEPSVALAHGYHGRGFTDLRCLAPKGGAPMAPPLLLGGGRFVASLLVLVSFTSKFTNILGLIGW